MMNNWNNGWESGAWLWMSVMMLVFWGAVAWVLVTFASRSRTRPPETSDQPAPR